MQTKQQKRTRLKQKIKARNKSRSIRPRLSIFRSNNFIYAQIIDDNTGKTLAQASDLKMNKGTKIEKAKEVGKSIAETSKTLKVEKVVFDRNGFRYTGRVKSLADGAREGGLRF